MASRKVEDLHWMLQKQACDLITLCKKEGLEIIITCTYRSPVEQDILYAQGRTSPGHIVTWAKGGESLHNYRTGNKAASLAFDVCPIINGKAYWTTEGVGNKIWSKIGELGESLDLEWAGRWSAGKREFPHFQLNKGAIVNVENYQKQTSRA
jgi:peptidoglycan L-alanyl-D-glutamate endopeptidase CwlK